MAREALKAEGEARTTVSVQQRAGFAESPGNDYTLLASQKKRYGVPMFGLGFGELLVILIVLLLVFGPAKLPSLGTALGEGIKNFRKGYRESKAVDVTPTEQLKPGEGSGDDRKP